MAKKINIYETKANLSKLINRVMEGEEIIIAKAGEPVAKLVPIRKNDKDRKPGLFKGILSYSDDIDMPLPEELAEEFYK